MGNGAVSNDYSYSGCSYDGTRNKALPNGAYWCAKEGLNRCQAKRGGGTIYYGAVEKYNYKNLGPNEGKLCRNLEFCDPAMGHFKNCYMVDKQMSLINVAWDPTRILGECEGDCDQHSDCSGDLKCWHREEEDGSDPIPPGCKGDPYSARYDYCYNPDKSDYVFPVEQPADFKWAPETADYAILALLLLLVINALCLCFGCFRRANGGCTKRNIYRKGEMMSSAGDEEEQMMQH